MLPASDQPPLPPDSLSARKILPAAAVAMGSAGILLTGPSKSGKSSLAAMLIIHYGARLISDDMVEIGVESDAIRLSFPEDAPRSLFGLMISRRLGWRRVPAIEGAPLRWILLLSRAGLPPCRLPEFGSWIREGKVGYRQLDPALYPVLEKGASFECAKPTGIAL